VSGRLISDHVRQVRTGPSEGAWPPACQRRCSAGHQGQKVTLPVAAQHRHHGAAVIPGDQPAGGGQHGCGTKRMTVP
jgi:hypothetical protein